MKTTKITNYPEGITISLLGDFVQTEPPRRSPFNAPESVVIDRINYALDSLKEVIQTSPYIDISESNSFEELLSKVKPTYDKLIELKNLIESRVEDLI